MLYLYSNQENVHKIIKKIPLRTQETGKSYKIWQLQVYTSGEYVNSANHFAESNSKIATKSEYVHAP